MRAAWHHIVAHPRSLLLAALVLFAGFPLLPKALIWPGRAVFLLCCLGIAAHFVMKLRSPGRERRLAVFAMVAAMLGLGAAYGLLELASWAYLRKAPLSGDPFVMTERQKESVRAIIDGTMAYVVHSPTVGAVIGKNQTSPDGLYRSNSAGIRADREYAKEKPPGTVRVLCFGDSFTHCDEVGNQDTWAHQAELAAPGMEFLNFGIPGSGLTQAYLRYKEAAVEHAADYVIIGCMTEDIKRGVNVYMPFRHSNPALGTTALATPYAALDEQGKLAVHPPLIATREDYAAFLEEPLPMLRKMSKADLLFRPQPPTPFLRLAADRWENLSGGLNPAADHLLESCKLAFNTRKLERSLRDFGSGSGAERKRKITEISRLLFLRFAGEVEKNGSVPLVVWFPSPMNLVARNEGKPRDYRHYFEFFADKGIHAVDTMDWIEEIGGIGKPLPLDKIMARVHFSASTNARLGRRIAEFIRGLERAAEPG